MEAGFPDFALSVWWGMAAPAGTPDDVLDILHQAVTKAQLTDPVVERFSRLGLFVPHATRAQFTASLKPESDFWLETIQRGKIRVP